MSPCPLSCPHLGEEEEEGSEPGPNLLPTWVHEHGVCACVCVHACARVCCIRQQATIRVNYPGNIGKIQNGGKKNLKKHLRGKRKLTATPPKILERKKKERKKERKFREENGSLSPLSVVPPPTTRVLPVRHGLSRPHVQPWGVTSWG